MGIIVPPGPEPIGPTPPVQKHLEALTAVWGEQLDELAGTHGTKLTAPLPLLQAFAEVESTLGFPDEGVFYVGGERIDYSGKDDGVFAGLTRPVEYQRLHSVGSVVEDWSRWWSAYEQARRDVYPSMAEGRWLDVQSLKYGERRPSWPMTDETWREVLLELLWLDRGTWWAVWRVLRAVLKPWQKYDAAAVVEHHGTAVNAAFDFRLRHVHRYVTIDDRGPYRIVAVAGTNAVLATHGGPWWIPAEQASSPSASVALLPFTIEEHDDGWVRIGAAVPPAEANVPPTYLRPQGPPWATPPEVPRGGQLMPDQSFVVPGSGDRPLYLGGGFQARLAAWLRDVLVAGARCRVDLIEP